MPPFEPIPSGELVAQPAANGGRVPAQRVEQLLGPMPGTGRSVQQLHTNKDDEEPAKPVHRDQPKIGRNELCPCGSGKKFKRCHGTAA
jgi:uncharacterized protein YecA (UPF0149 family)